MSDVISQPSDEEIQWIEVTESLSPLEADVIKSRLEAADIPALIEQEAIGIVMGLTVGPLGSARVLVPEVMSAVSGQTGAQTLSNCRGIR
ncbi:MAG: hypothetical protein B6243_10600 [Anaerolineaceae bacterium 4572_5.2]|nr:MAG: hypothetical protein B6243_10600 [Anaerolineaceae bacterium 4572_5.2]